MNHSDLQRKFVWGVLYFVWALFGGTCSLNPFIHLFCAIAIAVVSYLAPRILNPENSQIPEKINFINSTKIETSSVAQTLINRFAWGALFCVQALDEFLC